MKKSTLPWLAKKTTAGPAPTIEPPAAPVAEKPRPEPAPATPPPPLPKRPRPDRVPASEEASPGWLTPTRAMVLVASVPSVLSLVLMVSTAMDITAGPEGSGNLAGLASGLFYDAIVIVLVAIAWFQPSVRTLAGAGGWVGAALASAVILWHYEGEQMLWAAVPVGAKFAWHLALKALTAQEDAQAEHDRLAAEEERARVERERALAAAAQAHEEQDAKADDSSLTVEQRQILAKLDNEATFTEEQAKRQRRLDDAKAKVDHESELAEIERTAKENMARMEATAKLMVHKAQLEERIELSSPPSRQRFALGSGAYAPDNAASIIGDDGMGFGAVMNHARAASSPTVRTGPAEQVPTPADTPIRGGAQVSAEEGARNRALVWDTRDQIIEETGKAPSINALAEATGLSRRAVGRHLKADD